MTDNTQSSLQQSEIHTSTASVRRPVLIALLTVCTISFILGILLITDNPYIPQARDDIEYLLAARNNPILNIFPTHGWLYPLLIKVVRPFSTSEYTAARSISLLAMVLFVCLSTSIAFRFLRQFEAFLVGLLLATHPTVLEWGTSGMADMLFAALAGGVVWFMTFNRISDKRLFLAGAICALSVFVRGNGIILLPAVPIFVLITGNLTKRGVCAFGLGAMIVSVITIGGFLFADLPLSRILPSGGPAEYAWRILDKNIDYRNYPYYQKNYTSYITLLTQHPIAVFRAAAKTTFHLHDRLLLPQFLALGFFTVPGVLLWLRGWRRIHLCVFGIYISLFFPIMFLTADNFVRYSLCCFPMIIIASVYGLRLLSGYYRFSSRRVLRLRHVLLILCCCMSLAYSARTLVTNRHQPQRKQAKSMCEAGFWLKPQLHPNDRIVATFPNIAYYANGKFVNFSDVFDRTTPTRGDIAAKLKTANCYWLVWIKGHSQYMWPDLIWLESESNAPNLAMVYRNDTISVWKVVKDRPLTDH